MKAGAPLGGFSSGRDGVGAAYSDCGSMSWRGVAWRGEAALRAGDGVAGGRFTVFVVAGYGDVRVGVDVQGNLDFRNAILDGLYVAKSDEREGGGIAHVIVITLQQADIHLISPRRGGGKHLLSLGGDGRVALDQPLHRSLCCLDAEMMRSRVEQQRIAYLTRQHARLDGRADGDYLVLALPAMQPRAEDGSQALANGGHARHAARQHHMVDLFGCQLGVGER